MKRRDLKKQQLAIVKYLKRLGGHGTIGDARKAAKVNQAYYHMKQLIRAGCVKRVARNDYSGQPMRAIHDHQLCC